MIILYYVRFDDHDAIICDEGNVRFVYQEDEFFPKAEFSKTAAECLSGISKWGNWDVSPDSVYDLSESGKIIAERCYECTDIEILMEDGCTLSEAKKHLQNGTIVFRDFEEHLHNYINEWCPNLETDDDDFIYACQLKSMVQSGKALPDWGIVRSKDGKKYYIEYVL